MTFQLVVKRIISQSDTTYSCGRFVVRISTQRLKAKLGKMTKVSHYVPGSVTQQFSSAMLMGNLIITQIIDIPLGNGCVWIAIVEEAR